MSLGALLVICASTGFGLLISSFVKSQIAAIFSAAIIVMLPTVNFSGTIYPTATLEGAAYWFGTLFPGSWFETISLGAFTKGLSFLSFGKHYLALALFYCVYLSIASLLLRKQEK